MELILDRLTKQYKNKIAVDKVSLTLGQGVYGLLGANGAGKTTLMRMMCGLLDPTGGEVKFNGIDVSRAEYRDALGYMPQHFGYYPEFTATSFLHYMASLKGLTKQRSKEKTAELLETVSLSEVAKKKIKTFSGGMKQRLGIAQSLLNNPKILILDEPTAGLDPKERIKFRNLISRLGADRIVLLSTHIVSDIENIAKFVLVMKDGQIIQNGGVDEILTDIRGKVFECVVDDAQAAELSQKFPVVNIRAAGPSEEHAGKTLLRLIASDNNPPCENAETVPENLDDLYMYYFGERNE
ncbi:MAG: ABC transporter ATP-binding protein [Defluviitaleaceae bacterium]|nr:ABC transporter ATP-binding protein [Defluviitaleaceae bacterium]